MNELKFNNSTAHNFCRTIDGMSSVEVMEMLALVKSPALIPKLEVLTKEQLEHYFEAGHRDVQRCIQGNELFKAYGSNDVYMLRSTEIERFAVSCVQEDTYYYAMKFANDSEAVVPAVGTKCFGTKAILKMAMFLRGSGIASGIRWAIGLSNYNKDARLRKELQILVERNAAEKSAKEIPATPAAKPQREAITTGVYRCENDDKKIKITVLPPAEDPAKDPLVPLAANVPRSLKQVISDAAKQSGVSMSVFVRDIITDWIESGNDESRPTDKPEAAISSVAPTFVESIDRLLAERMNALLASVAT